MSLRSCFHPGVGKCYSKLFSCYNWWEAQFSEAKCRDSIHKMWLWRRQFGLLLLGKSNQTAITSLQN